MAKLVVTDHPLIQHKISMLRRKQTTCKDFSQITREIAALMTYEATRDLQLEEEQIETPICPTVATTLAAKVTVVAILRAGLGMVDGVLDMFPAARVGHIGLYRDPVTHKPHEYFCKMPKDVAESRVIIVDPMLATGGSAIAAVELLRQHGVDNPCFMCMIAAPEGVKAFTEACPDVDLYVCAIDECLNENAYIVPGLGDAGDRIFGTI